MSDAFVGKAEPGDTSDESFDNLEPRDTSDAPAAPAPRKRTRWTWILLLLTLLVGGGVAAAHFGPQLLGEWEATSLLHVDWQPFRLLPDAAPPPPADSYLLMRDEFRRTQTTLAKSRLVLNATLRNTKVANLPLLKDLGNEPLDWLEQNLHVSFPDSLDIMEISLRSSKYEENLVPLVDVITQAYLEEVVEKETRRRQEQLALLHEVSRKFEEKVKGIRHNLGRLQEQVGPGDKPPSFRQEQARADYDDARAELTRTRSSLRRLRVQAAVLDRGREKAGTEPERKANRDKLRGEIEFLQELEKRLEADAEQLAKQNRDVPVKALDLIDLQNELEEKEATLKALHKRAAALSVELEAPPRVRIIQAAVLRKKKGQ
jgi:uncharacterized protein involved in exopolysaccharide biosynthesis